MGIRTISGVDADLRSFDCPRRATLRYGPLVNPAPIVETVVAEPQRASGVPWLAAVTAVAVLILGAALSMGVVVGLLGLPIALLGLIATTITARSLVGRGDVGARGVLEGLLGYSAGLATSIACLAFAAGAGEGLLAEARAWGAGLWGPWARDSCPPLALARRTITGCRGPWHRPESFDGFLGVRDQPLGGGSAGNSNPRVLAVRQRMDRPDGVEEGWVPNYADRLRYLTRNCFYPVSLICLPPGLLWYLVRLKSVMAALC